MIGWHHRRNGQEFEQALGNGEGHGYLGCCSPWGHKELDTTEQLNSNSNARGGVGLPEGLLSPRARSRRQGTTSTSPGVGTGVPAAISDSRGGHELLPLPRVTRPGAPASLGVREGHTAAHPLSGIMGSTC